MSVVRLTALGAYALIAIWAWWSGGVPFERTVVIAWFVGAALIALVGRRPGVAARAVADWVPFVALMVAYDLTRGAADGLGMPLQVRMPIAIDETLFGTVPTVWLQERLGPFGPDVAWWEVPVSLIYVSHYVVPFALGVWWWVRDHDRWRWWRDRFVTLTALGLATYVLLPTAPPWMASERGEIGPVERTAARGWRPLGLDVADRVFDLGRAAVNQTAALPSLHAAFAAFVAVALWRRVDPRLRPLVAAYPVAMGFVLVLTGEHYVADAILGWVYVAATILLWRRIGPRVETWRSRWVAATAAPPVTVAHEPSEPPPTDVPGRRVPGALAALAGGLGLVALVSRAVRLGDPDTFVFDEIFYATQALEIAQTGVEEGHTVHPPVAKWAMAGGIRLLGFTPVGWRLVPLLAGALVVALTVLAASRLTRSRPLAALAGAVVAFDGIAVTTGRLALLDGIVALWTTAALVLALDVAAHPLDVPRLRRRAVPMAVLFGLAIATKWSAAPVWLVTVGVMLWLLRSATVPLRRTAALLIATPLAVYALTYVPTLVAYGDSAVARVACADGITCGDGPLDRLRAIVHDHVEMLEFHTGLEPTNRYAVSSWNWIVQSQPTLLHQDPSTGEVVEARSNPAIWLAGTAALVWCGWVATRRRSPTAIVLVLTALAWWAPWAIGRRPGYSFYAAPLVPVLALAITAILEALPRRSRTVASVAVGATLLLGVLVLAPRWYA